MMQNSEQKIDIRTIMRALSPKQRELGQELIFEDMTCAEYARKKEVSKSAISQTLTILRIKLKYFLSRLNFLRFTWAI